MNNLKEKNEVDYIITFTLADIFLKDIKITG